MAAVKRKPTKRAARTIREIGAGKARVYVNARGAAIVRLPHALIFIARNGETCESSIDWEA